MHWGAPAGQQCKVARRSWNLRDVCVDGTTVILSVMFSTGYTMHWARRPASSARLLAAAGA